MKETELKNKVNSFLQNVETLTQKKIINTEDTPRLLEIIFKENKTGLLETLAFNSKYLQGLVKVIQSGDQNISQNYFIKVKSEYSICLNKIKDDLERVIKLTANFYADIFREKYFSITADSLQNLNSLCGDFALIKLYLNGKKREEV